MADQTPPQRATPAPRPETPRTVAEFRAVVSFIRARVADEYQAAGALSYYLDKGVSIRPYIPRSYDGYRDTAKEHTSGWLAEHTPERGLAVVDALADLAEGLADQMAMTLSSPVWSFQADRAWRQLVKAAQLWRDHADFQAGWEPAADRGKG
ncbi:DUF6221 family protein [Streptomyces seoulensis]